MNMKKSIILIFCIITLLSAALAEDSATVTVDGVGEHVSVTLTMEDDRITSVIASSDNIESDERGKESLALISSAMVEKNNIAVDTISGATCTSNAVIAGAAEAWLQIMTERMSKEAWMGLSQSPESSEDSSGKKVYFAAPLFSRSEKDYNLQLTQILEDHGYEVFLPQRDGYLAAELEGKAEEELTQMIFEKDLSEVLKADIIFMVLDGRIPDEGACVELGIAYANGKRCYGVKTDARSVEINMDLNPMIAGCFLKLFKNFDGDALVEELEQYLSENAL